MFISECLCVCVCVCVYVCVEGGELLLVLLLEHNLYHRDEITTRTLIFYHLAKKGNFRPKGCTVFSSALRGRTHILRPLGRICPFIHDIKTPDLGIKSLTSQY